MNNWIPVTEPPTLTDAIDPGACIVRIVTLRGFARARPGHFDFHYSGFYADGEPKSGHRITHWQPYPDTEVDD